MSGTTTMTVSAGSTGGVINVSGANAMTFTGVVTAAAINASSLTGILTVTAAAANAISITGGTAADVITGSASADLLTGNNGADTFTGRAGNDSIVLTETTAAVDKVVFTGGATAAAALTANGMDTITGFGATDTLNIAALGDGTTSATGLTTVNGAAAQAALVDDTVVILNVAATAGALATGGTATVTDFTNMTQVAAFLSERYTTTNDADQENVIVWNVGTTTYVYHVDTLVGGTTAIAAAEIVLLGTITQGAALTSANLVYA
jgi:Ca2+-binding RTX toxin-like protein